MTKLERIRQQNLKQKAAMKLDRPLRHIKKVVEHPNPQNPHIGATVYMNAGAMPWINIPLWAWIGEDKDGML